jgi:hypothetical protein
MCAKTRASWYNLAQLAERNCRQLITALLKAIQKCTTELDVHGAMFGVLNGESSLHTVVFGIVAQAYNRNLPWDKVYREASNAITMNIAKTFCVAWWTEARMLFGSYLPYSDEASNKQTGCRRLGRDVCNNDGLWGAILADLKLVTKMPVRASLDWYRPKSQYIENNAASSWNTDVVNVLMNLLDKPLKGNGANHLFRKKPICFHASMRAARACLCPEDLFTVAADNSAAVDVVAVGVREVQEKSTKRATERRNSQLLYQIDPLYFDKALLRKGVEYSLYTGLVCDMLPARLLLVIATPEDTTWGVISTVINWDDEGDIEIRIRPLCDIHLTRMMGPVARLVPIKTVTSTLC